VTIRAYLYDADGTDREVSLTTSAVLELNERQLLWVDLTAFNEDELRETVDTLNLPSSLVDHLLRPFGRPRLVNLKDFIYLGVDAVNEDKNELALSRLSFVIGANLVVTLHEKPIEFLNSFDRRVVGDSQLGELDAPAFLAALLDWHVTSYFRLIEKIEEEVDNLDDRALKSREQDEILPKLISLRRRVAQLRRALTPHREVYAALVRPDFPTISDTIAAPHFTLLTERLAMAIEAVENARELLVGSFNIHASQSAQHTNNTMRVLTVVTVMLLPAGVITGIMGMNLKARAFELGEKGFWGVVALIAVLGISTIIIARNREWM